MNSWPMLYLLKEEQSIRQMGPLFSIPITLKTKQLILQGGHLFTKLLRRKLNPIKTLKYSMTLKLRTLIFQSNIIFRMIIYSSAFNVLSSDGVTETKKFRQIFAADGAFSVVRKHFTK
jgi:hypothetical protein